MGNLGPAFETCGEGSAAESESQVSPCHLWEAVLNQQNLLTFAVDLKITPVLSLGTPGCTSCPHLCWFPS